jgi:hypothetical protein
MASVDRRKSEKKKFWCDAALKKEGYTKIAKNSQQACKLLFSWGWMVDKLVRSINFEKNGELLKGRSTHLSQNRQASNF